MAFGLRPQQIPLERKERDGDTAAHKSGEV